MVSGASLQGSNAERNRSANRQAVLGRIQSAGQMGRAEIARALGLSTQAVSNIIAELEGEGMLVETGTRSAGRGMPAVQYGVNPEGGYAMGIEIRPDAVFTALLDLHGAPVATSRSPVEEAAPDRIVALVQRQRDALLAEAQIGADRLLGVGVVMPGPFGETGISGTGSDLPGWQVVDARALFQDVFDLPVELSNDANAAAMSERIGGVAQGLSTYAYLYFGAGLGLGLVSRGQLLEGAFGNAGEIGHVPVSVGSDLVPLESVLSRVSVQRHLAQYGPLNVAVLETLYRDQDAALLAWLDQASGALSQALALIENLFDPQTVILGGAMPASILDHLVTEVALPQMSVRQRSDTPLPRVQRGASGRMTATLGAASLILNRAFSPQAAAL